MFAYRYYYTLRDLAHYSTDRASGAITDNEGIYDFIKTIDDEIIGTDDTYTKTLWKDYIYPRYYKCKVCYCDGGYTEPEDDDDIVLDMQYEFVGKIYAWLMASKERYEKLLVLYTSKENNLLDKLKSTNTVIFNDTPQSSSPDTDTYITNYTKSETTSDPNTVIGMLDEVKQKLNSLYEEWANEFAQFIIW